MSHSVVEQRLQQLLEELQGSGPEVALGPNVDLFWEPGPDPDDLGG